MATWRDARVEHAIRFSACTTSGQFWQDEREVGLEVRSRRRAPAICSSTLGVDLRRVAADLQQRQHQRGELVAQRDAGEADADVGAGAVDARTTGLRVVVVGVGRRVILSRQRRRSRRAARAARADLALSSSEATSSIGCVTLLEVGLQLGLQCGVEHGGSPVGRFGRRTRGSGRAPGAAPGRGAASGSGQILPTRSSDGARVSSPSSHLAGQTSPGWARDVLGGLDLAQQLDGVAADAVGGDLDDLDHAVGVDHEGAAVGQALVFDAARRSCG